MDLNWNNIGAGPQGVEGPRSAAAEALLSARSSGSASRPPTGRRCIYGSEQAPRGLRRPGAKRLEVAQRPFDVERRRCGPPKPFSIALTPWSHPLSQQPTEHGPEGVRLLFWRRPFPAGGWRGKKRCMECLLNRHLGRMAWPLRGSFWAPRWATRSHEHAAETHAAALERVTNGAAAPRARGLRCLHVGCGVGYFWYVSR